MPHSNRVLSRLATSLLRCSCSRLQHRVQLSRGRGLLSGGFDYSQRCVEYTGCQVGAAKCGAMSCYASGDAGHSVTTPTVVGRKMQPGGADALVLEHDDVTRKLNRLRLMGPTMHGLIKWLHDCMRRA